MGVIIGRTQAVTWHYGMARHRWSLNLWLSRGSQACSSWRDIVCGYHSLIVNLRGGDTGVTFSTVRVIHLVRVPGHETLRTTIGCQYMLTIPHIYSQD